MVLTMRLPFGRLAAALTLSTLILTVSPAFAGDVVIYGPGTPSPDAAATAQAAYRVATSSEEPPSGGVAHVLDLPFPSQDPLWMAGDLLQLPCADSTLAEVDPAERLELAIAHVDELDYEKALLEIDAGLKALPCTRFEVSRQTLIDLHFFQGMAHYDLGNQAKAKRGFLAALAVNIDMPWKKEYPPAPQAVFLDAKSELLGRGTTTLGIDPTGAGLKSLSGDGGEVPIGSAAVLTLYRGRHLVRYVDADGNAHGSLVDVGEDGGALMSREALRAVVLNLAWGGVGTSAGKIALAELARNRGADRAIVIVLGAADAAPRAFSFEVAGGAMLPLAVDGEALAALLDEDSKGKGKGKGGAGGGGAAVDDDNRAGRVGVVVNGGLGVAGRNPDGVAALRLHIRLVKGLELGVGGQAGFRDSVAGTILLPAVTFDLRYRLEGGPFHMYFGGRGLVGFSHDQQDTTSTEVLAIGGGGAVVGFDITPGGDKGFINNVDVAAGVTNRAGISGAQLFLTAGAGIGARF